MTEEEVVVWRILDRSIALYAAAVRAGVMS
jgi:hypothetical protein